MNVSYSDDFGIKTESIRWQSTTFTSTAIMTFPLHVLHIAKTIYKQLFSALHIIQFCLMCLKEGVKYLSMAPIPLLLPLISFKCQMWWSSCRLCCSKCSRLSRPLNVGVDDRVQTFPYDIDSFESSLMIWTFGSTWNQIFSYSQILWNKSAHFSVKS